MIMLIRRFRGFLFFVFVFFFLKKFWFFVWFQKDAAKQNGGEKKVAADAGAAKKADDGNVTVVLKMDLHCEGCAQKVKRAIKNFGGKQLNNFN